MKNHILNRSEGKNSTTGWAQPVGLIAFDADDTLWDNQGHFEAVEALRHGRAGVGGAV